MELLSAAFSGNYDLFMSTIEKNVSTIDLTFDNNSILLTSIRGGSTEIVDFLLNNGIYHHPLLQQTIEQLVTNRSLKDLKMITFLSNKGLVFDNSWIKVFEVSNNNENTESYVYAFWNFHDEYKRIILKVFNKINNEEFADYFIKYASVLNTEIFRNCLFSTVISKFRLEYILDIIDTRDPLVLNNYVTSYQKWADGYSPIYHRHFRDKRSEQQKIKTQDIIFMLYTLAVRFGLNDTNGKYKKHIVQDFKKREESKVALGIVDDTFDIVMSRYKHLCPLPLLKNAFPDMSIVPVSSDEYYENEHQNYTSGNIAITDEYLFEKQLSERLLILSSMKFAKK